MTVKGVDFQEWHLPEVRETGSSLKSGMHTDYAHTWMAGEGEQIRKNGTRILNRKTV